MTGRKILNAALLANELNFTTSRSGGPGGQNVNKVNSKVSLKWNIVKSRVLNAEERGVILTGLTSRLTREGTLMMSAQEKRSQLENKEAVMQKLEKLLNKAFEKKKVRKATKPSKGAVKRRMEDKKLRAEKKKWRQKLG